VDQQDQRTTALLDQVDAPALDGHDAGPLLGWHGAGLSHPERR
jgi:hypothetical protein